MSWRHGFVPLWGGKGWRTLLPGWEGSFTANRLLHGNLMYVLVVDLVLPDDRAFAGQDGQSIEGEGNELHSRAQGKKRH